MFEGKTAIITGASRGIGRAVALKLASLGADIAVIYAGNTEAAMQSVSECTAYGVKAAAYRCNVASSEDVKATVSQVKKDFGSVHILVNNAGITRDGLIAMMSEDAWDEVMDTNLKGAYLMIRAVCPLMLGQANYAASKAGLIGLTKSVARELASKGITCNAVAPGFIQSDMTKDIKEDNPLLASIPLMRTGRGEDVASAVAFLASSSYITGEVIRVDGGLAM